MRWERRSPPIGSGEIPPVAAKRATQRTALAMLTPKRLAAALRDMPPATTALTTRWRRSSESAIPAASFAAEIMNQNNADSGIPSDSLRSDTALAVFAGGAAAMLSFRLLPPLSPALRTRRLLALALRDLHRLAVDSLPPSSEDWEGRMYSRLAALPDIAEPLQRAQLLAALSVGNEIMQLRRISPLLGLDPELD